MTLIISGQISTDIDVYSVALSKMSRYLELVANDNDDTYKFLIIYFRLYKANDTHFLYILS